MTKCEKAETFFEEMSTFKLYAGIESSFYRKDNENMTLEEYNYALKRIDESKTKLYNLIMGE